MSSTRGWRNKNPGNLKYSRNVEWQGMDSPPSDGVFIRFKSLAWGVRAMIKLAYTYKSKYKIDTLGKYMSRYAPIGPENSVSYHNYVSETTGIELNEKIDLADRDTLARILRAQIAFENGSSLEEVDTRLPEEVWNSAFSLAKPLTQSREMRGGAASIAAGMGGVILDVVNNHLETATTAAAAVVPIAPDWARWVLITVAIAGGLVVWYARSQARMDGNR